jgi:hypothetical protein
LALEHASKELKNDRDLVCSAVRNKYEAFKYASDSLKQSRELVEALVSQNGLILEFLGPKYWERVS